MGEKGSKLLDAFRYYTILCLLFSFTDFPWFWDRFIFFRCEHPTLALMMVGLGSKMPCIFLKAGMTKRLQVTTADTGFPRTSTRTEGQRERTRGKGMRKQPLSSRRTNQSFSQLYTLPGRAKISLREPSMSKVANVVGRLKKREKF